jgi:hypothetical protein
MACSYSAPDLSHGRYDVRRVVAHCAQERR